MENTFQKVAHIISGPRTKWITLMVWILLASLLTVFAPSINAEENKNAPQLPDSSWSIQAQQTSQKYWPEQNGIPALIVWNRNGGLTDKDLRNIQTFTSDLEVHPITGQISLEPLHKMPLQALESMKSNDRTSLVSTVTFKPNTPDTILQIAVQNIEQRITKFTGASVIENLSNSGLHVRVTGPAGISADTLALFANVDVTLLLATVLLILVLLVLLYRSPLLAIIPLIGVGFAYGVISPILGLLAKSGVIVVDPESMSIMTVLLFGAGTDYCLFLVARFREDLFSIRDHHHAMRKSLLGAADAVGMSALTVVVSLLTLLTAKIGSFHRFAIPFSLAVLIMAIAGLTLVPALLSIFGRSSFYPFIPRTPEMTAELMGKQKKKRRKLSIPQRSGVGRFSHALGQIVAKKPWPVLLVGIVILSVLSVFALQSREKYDPLTSLPESTRSRQGFTLLADHYSPGTLAPVNVMVDTKGREVNLSESLTQLTFVKDVRQVQRSSVNANFEQVQVILNEYPFSLHAISEVPAIRDAVRKAILDSGSTDPDQHFWVGGQTATLYDSQQLMHRDTRVVMPLVILIISLLLLAYLRSLVAMVYLIATVVFSFLGALGAGWLFLHYVLGIQELQGGVQLYAFIFLVALGEDYNIFMISRIWQESAHRPILEAISEGVSRTSSVITSAGLILAGTFAVLTGLPGDILLEFGTIAAIGVLLDTFIVRPLMVPALTAILGRFAFWPGKPRRGTHESS